MLGGESPEKIPRRELIEEIKNIVQERDEVTENLLPQMIAGQSPRQFIEKACKLAKIKPPKATDSLAPFVFLLQRDALKFKQTDTYDGCDGKFGPITFDALIKKFPVLNPKPRQQVLERSRKERRKLAKKSGLPTPSSAPKQKKDVEREPINHKEVSYYGDSLTQQYTKYILSHREFQNHKNKNKKIELINKKIRTFANRFPKNIRVIDLHKDFVSMIKKYGRSTMLYSDKVHMKPKAARAVAQMVQDSVATGTYRNIEEYLS